MAAWAKTLHAECGAEVKCDLNITVAKSGAVILMPELFRLLHKRVEDVKTSLIELKIRHALGAVTDDDVVKQFAEERELLGKLSAAAASIDERLLSVTDSPQKHADIRLNRGFCFNWC